MRLFNVYLYKFIEKIINLPHIIYHNSYIESEEIMDFPVKAKEYKTAEHLMFSCQYHVIFCPKYRRQIFTSPYDEALKGILVNISKDYDFSILDMEVMPDHIHLVIDCNPRFGIMQCVNKLKGISSNRMRTQFPELKKRLPTLWTRSSFISTVGSVSLAVTQEYIKNQKNR